MKKEIKENIGGACSVRPHDCWNYTETEYHIGSEGTAKVCGTCGKILEFRYRSFWICRFLTPNSIY